jgi:hypothetical protein
LISGLCFAEDTIILHDTFLSDNHNQPCPHFY